MKDHIPTSDSDIDSEPEEVPASASKLQAQTLFDQERKAVKSQKDAKKEERRKQIERNIRQKQEKQKRNATKVLDIDALPESLLEDVNADSIEQALNEEKKHLEKLEESRKKKPKKVSNDKNKKKVMSKVMKTPSTTFQVVEVGSHIGETLRAARRDKDSCFGFRDQMLYNNRRLGRVKTAHLKGIREKIAVAKASR